MKTKKVFKKRLAIYLQDQGCEILQIQRNLSDPSQYVYIFEDTDRLQNAWNEFLRTKESK